MIEEIKILSDNPQEFYEFLIQCGKKLHKLETPGIEIKSCQSKLEIYVQHDPFCIMARTESLFIAGILYVMQEVINETPTLGSLQDLDAMLKLLRLDKLISPGRQLGLVEIIGVISENLWS